MKAKILSQKNNRCYSVLSITRQKPEWLYELRFFDGTKKHFKQSEISILPE